MLAFLAQMPPANSVALAVPEFEAYATSETFLGKPALPILTTPRQRSYRTTILLGAQNGPNFAGRYRIIMWGCGSGCVGFFVADAQTGRVYDAPFDYVDFPVWGVHPYGLEFKDDSTLLRVGGCLHDKNCGVYYYEWTGSQWKIVATAKLPEFKSK